VLIHPRFIFSFKWTVERALEEVGKIIGRAVNEFYTPITFNSHPVSFATYSSPLIEGTWDMALAAGMPIISADRWLAWTAARNQVRIELDADGCTVYSPLALDRLTLLLPEGTTPQAEQATVGKQTLWGKRYTVITLKNLATGEGRRLTWG
jgi:hypothetical protein